MVEPILRHGMQKVALRLQLSPQLERFRARVPYFPVPGVVAALLVVPAAALLLLAQAMGYRGTTEMTLARSWWTLALAPPGAALVFAAIETLGYASGYRPFRRAWEGLSSAEARDVAQRLLRCAQSQGFATAWHDRVTGSFVALRNMELEKRRQVSDGSTFPMRLSVFVRPTAARASVDLKLAARTVVVWDTGERDSCTRIGRSVVDAAALHDEAA